MSKDLIERLAREAGGHYDEYYETFEFTEEKLACLIALVAEECAKVADEKAAMSSEVGDALPVKLAIMACQSIAGGIRGRFKAS